MNRLLTIWDSVRTSLWLLPSVMVIAAVGLAVAMLKVDAGFGAEDRLHTWWIHRGNGDDARNLLSNLLTSTITMASMVFSVTVVALTLAANSYGSRLIRIFRSDLWTQFALGIFAMCIVYCLIVLREIRSDAANADVPHLSVTLGTALALVSVLTLLGFIQSVARSMVADEVVRRVRRDMDDAVKQFAELDESDLPSPDDAVLPVDFDARAARIEMSAEGYVQAIDYDGLLEWAVAEDRILKLEFRAGDFIAIGDRLIQVYPAPSDLSRTRDAIQRFVVTGAERTPTQDLEFAIRHLVEVALRALSPGINDPYTAMVVVDRLRGSLSKLMGHRLFHEAVRDHQGVLRLHRRIPTYAGLLDESFHQIRQAASTHPTVLIHMLHAIGRIADHARLAEQRDALARHALLLLAAAERDVSDPSDRHEVEQRFRRTMAALEAGRA